MAGGNDRVHQPRRRDRVGAGEPVLIQDVGGVDRQSVKPIRRGQTCESIDLIGRARYPAERDTTRDQVRAAVVAEHEGAWCQAGGVDQIVEGDVDR